MIIIISEISPLLGSKGDAAIYIFNRNCLINNYEAITAAFTAKYTNFKIAYSFKTNYLKEIITTVHDLDGGAEVVSPYELWYAQALKFAPTAIVYNGVIPDLECKYSHCCERHRQHRQLRGVRCSTGKSKGATRTHTNWIAGEL